MAGWLAQSLLLCLPETSRKWTGKALIFTLTYLAYGLATACRLPYSIAKTSLRPDHPSSDIPGWRPFTDADGQVLLGSLDTVYMFGYALAMPFMGAVADRGNQVLFLAIALVLIGGTLIAIGLAHQLDIHFYAYFVVVTFLGGCAQSIAYPCVIAVIAKWTGKSRIGLYLGIWSSCTPMGTIVGKLGCTAALDSGWQMAFILPGFVSIAFAVIIALCLVQDPYDVQLLRPGEARVFAEARMLGSSLSGTPSSPLSLGTNAESRASIASRRAAEVIEEEPVPLRTILRIPGMIAYCSACFFSKLAYYAFVFWLPYYLDHGLHYDDTKAGQMSTLFDWGGFVGGVFGGILIDKIKLRGIILLAFQCVAVPMLFLYMQLGNLGLLTDTSNACVLFALGFTVTTPYSLITSVMSTDLGRHESLQGNLKAAGTVTAILDGTGSFGAVVQGLVIGWISNSFGWGATFVMLMTFVAFSALCLIRPAMTEVRHLRSRGWPHQQSAEDANTSLQPVTC